MVKTAFSEGVDTFLSEKLCLWFLEHRRSFPWRENPTPYRVWVSEVMLQQTRAEVVVKYFIEWMHLFPRVEELASAHEDRVIKAWEGLGYYSRARNLLYGARVIVSEFGGKIPDHYSDLMRIKGIGPYTASAILAFAFKKRVVAVDGNVLRVMSRIFLVESSIELPSTQRCIAERASSLLPLHDPQIFSEALIELGACICSPFPKCDRCPIREGCGAYLQGKQHHFPVRRARKKITTLYRFVAIVVYDRHVVLEKRAQGEVMAGLYEFPYRACDPQEYEEQKKIFKQTLESQYHTRLVFCQEAERQEHAFTHHKVQLLPMLFSADMSPPKHLLYSLDDIDALPFSSGHRKVKEWVLRKYDERV